jgi:hypothetical protein
MRNVREWIEMEVYGVNPGTADYRDMVAYLEVSITALLKELKQSFQKIYMDIYEQIDILWARQLRSFFVADLVIPAVCDIAGCVFEHDLICYGKKAMHRVVLNALEEIYEKFMNAASLDYRIKLRIAHSWGLISSSKPDITEEEQRKICETLDRLLQSYKNIAAKYELKLNKFIDLIREKQLRNEFVHYKETIKEYRDDGRCRNHLEGFLALEENQSLKAALRFYDEIQILPSMFEIYWRFLQLPNANRQVFYLFLMPKLRISLS